MQGPRDTAPNTINETYFINSAQYNAKWAQYANFIHDEKKLHSNRFWSENVGQYDMMRYVTGINAGDPAYKKIDGKLDYFLGSYEMKFNILKTHHLHYQLYKTRKKFSFMEYFSRWNW